MRAGRMQEPQLSSDPGRADSLGSLTAQSYAGETYHGRPAIKPSPWDWKVSAYIFVGGMAGSAQIIATIADLIGRQGDRRVVRNGRYLAVVGAALGGPLLIADLHTPQRWYNMLRIFRPTSPMSIGSYILIGFGLFSGLTAAGQFLADRGISGGRLARRIARATQVPAALAGAGMSSYTAALLSATSTPLWAAAPRLLAGRFGSSAMASAAAALSAGERVGGNPGASRRLDRLALVALTADLAFSLAAENRYRASGVAGALQETRWGKVDRIGALAVGVALPAACYGISQLSRRHSTGLSVLAAAGVLVGGYLMRSAMLHAGNESAKRPADYLRFTQPDRRLARSAESHGDPAAVPQEPRDTLVRA